MADLFSHNPTINAGSLTTGSPVTAALGVAGLKFNNGTWTMKSLKKHNGSLWVAKPVKHHNGSAWV
jgi:hypothetical protein